MKPALLKHNQHGPLNEVRVPFEHLYHRIAAFGLAFLALKQGMGLVEQGVYFAIGQGFGHKPEVTAMRLSANKGDAGYGALQDIFAQGQIAIPFVDGVQVDKAVVADEEEGIVVACVVGSDGCLATADDGENFATRTIRGNVEIKLVERH